jgi:hypothetical protein
MWIDAACLGQKLFEGEAFNVVKFVLSIMSIFFDTIFLIQHYLLYGGARKNHEQD